MSKLITVNELGLALKHELEDCILPFWQNNVYDASKNEYIGRIYADNRICEQTDLGGILMSRVVWAFSAAGSVLQHDGFKQHAIKTQVYIDDNMLDDKQFNSLWSRDGLPYPNHSDEKICLAYRLYGLVEYYGLCQKEADGAIKAIFDEVFADLILNAKEINKDQTIEHIETYWRLAFHQLEACVNYAEKFQLSSELFAQLSTCVESACFGYLALDLNSGHVSSGAWLLMKAMDVCPEQTQFAGNIELFANKVAERYHSLQDESGGLQFSNEDESCYSWVQAEAFVAAWKLYQKTNDQQFLDFALARFQFIQDFIKDNSEGEWHDKPPYQRGCLSQEFKSDFWKCPYHNVRACLEVYQDLAVQNSDNS